MRKILIRPVGLEDKKDLARLYGAMDSCNANLETVDSTILDTQEALKGELKQLSFIAFDSESEEALGTGSLIWQKEIQMYKPEDDGLKLAKISGNIIEFGAMVVSPEAQGQGIGRAISEVRARFAHVFEADFFLAEFLPEYLDENAKTTKFWENEILPSLYASGNLVELKQACSDLLSKKIVSTEDLLEALETNLSTQQRNQVVNEFFPEYLPKSALEHCGTIGSQTKAALHNLKKIYPENFNFAGVFPVDGGQNYMSPGSAKAHLRVPFKVEGLNFSTILSSEEKTDSLDSFDTSELIAY